MPNFLLILLIIWLAFFGGAIGSFINVVVYRLPRGISLNHPGSRCPACEHPIRWYHNIPVLGWIALGGRCYDCGAKISFRYPLVEAITASLFVALALAGPLAEAADGPAQMSLSQLWTAVAFHAAWLSALLCLVLIEQDSHPASDTRPLRYLGSSTIFLGLLLPCVWPHLTAEMVAQVDDTVDPRTGALIAALKGGVTGFLLSVLALSATGFGPAGARGRTIAVGNLTLVGAFLGWQAIALVGTGAALGHLGMVALARYVPKMRPMPWSMLLFPLAVVWVVGQRPLADLYTLAESSLGRATLPAAFLAVFVLSLLGRAIARLARPPAIR